MRIAIQCCLITTVIKKWTGRSGIKCRLAVQSGIVFCKTSLRVINSKDDLHSAKGEGEEDHVRRRDNQLDDSLILAVPYSSIKAISS